MERKWKNKAVALTLLTTVSVASPLYLTGCGDSEVIVTGKVSEKDDAYHGVGATPFVFPDDDKGRNKLSKEELILNPYYRTVALSMYLQSQKDESRSGGSSSFIRGKSTGGSSSSSGSSARSSSSS